MWRTIFTTLCSLIGIIAAVVVVEVGTIAILATFTNVSEDTAKAIARFSPLGIGFIFAAIMALREYLAEKRARRNQTETSDARPVR